MNATEALIYLVSCAVNGKTPEPARLADLDLEALYRAAERHMLSAITAMALESAGIKNEAFTQAKGKAIRKNAALDEARGELAQRLEAAGIWYMPLKGAVLKDLYPRFGMRQMADNDILIDAARAADVREIMESLGYSTEHFGGADHDIYHKPPIYNFEIHTALFYKHHFASLYTYYRQIDKRLLPDGPGLYARHFSDEDFYLYLLAHEYKHYQNGGTGLRSLLDAYVYLRAKPELDLAYVRAEAEKLGIAEFEERQRRTAIALFSGRALGEEEREMASYMASSGVYGLRDRAFENHVHRELDSLGGGRSGRLKYIWRRLFLPADVIRGAYPFYDRHPWLIPALWIWRPIRTVLFRLKSLGRELRVLRKLKD